MQDRAWIEERITKTKELIVAFEDALLAVGNGAQSYQIDTGQTRMLVTKANLGQARITLSELEERLAMLQAQLGCGAYIARPAF